jgi:Cys-rich protein (TIGR01571 family)
MTAAPLAHPRYHSGLCSCLLDFPSCFYGLFCPCCLNAANLATARDEDCHVVHCIFCVCPFWTRQVVKQGKGISLSYGQDCLVTSCCTPCAICQDSRELHWDFSQSLRAGG